MHDVYDIMHVAAWARMHCAVCTTPQIRLSLNGPTSTLLTSMVTTISLAQDVLSHQSDPSKRRKKQKVDCNFCQRLQNLSRCIRSNYGFLGLQAVVARNNRLISLVLIVHVAPSFWPPRAGLSPRSERLWPRFSILDLRLR